MEGFIGGFEKVVMVGVFAMALKAGMVVELCTISMHHQNYL